MNELSELSFIETPLIDSIGFLLFYPNIWIKIAYPNLFIIQTIHCNITV